MAWKIFAASALSAALPRSAQCLEAACVTGHCRVILSPDLTMRYRIRLPDGYQFSSGNADADDADEGCHACKITVQLLYEGFAWVGIGASPEGKMVGSHAVVGQPEVHGPRTYYLGGKDPSIVVPYTRQSDRELEGTSVEFIDGQTVMEFTDSFQNWGIAWPIGPSSNNPHTLIWAHGSEGQEDPGYHGPSGKSSHTITNLMGFPDLPTEGGFSSDLMDQIAAALQQAALVASAKSAWLAHGVVAFLAFGILVPSAIATAILRDVRTSAMPEFCRDMANKISERWMHVHVGLNALGYVSTLVVFSLAVSTIKVENNFHWHSAHAKMGLSIFILASIQVIGGYRRPSKDESLGDAAREESEENENLNESSVGVVDGATTRTKFKSPRQVWELLHHLIGLALFFFGIFQMHMGMELYHVRYSSSDYGLLDGFYAGIYFVRMGLWVVVIVGGVAYKLLFRRRDTGPASDEGVELLSHESQTAT